MFTRLGTTVVRFRWLVIGAWVVAATLLALAGARWLYDVTTTDQKELLSANYESVKAADLAESALGDEKGTSRVTALVERKGSLASHAS
jgi:uncharacterized membrane protein YdfJ with MMPL/SSD domain